MISLARELSLWMGLGLSLTAGLCGALLFQSVRTQSAAEFDQASVASLRGLAARLEHDGEYVEFDTHDLGGAADSWDDFAIWLQHGDFLAGSRPEDEHFLPRRFGVQGTAEFWDQPCPDGSMGRAAGLRIPIPADEGAEPAEVAAEIVVVRSREVLDRAESVTLRGLWLAGGALMLAAGLVVLAAVRRVKKRLHALTDQLAVVDAGNLGARIADRELVRELQPLAASLNGLLSRVEQAFARERRMSSNIAHEMRTPVAELRTAVEVAQRWPDDPELSRKALTAAGRVSLRLSTTIHTLMRLARLREGAEGLDRQEVDLAAVVEEGYRSLPEAMRERDFERSIVAPVRLHTDEALVRILVRNLMENAFVHATGEGAVRSRIGAEDRVLWALDNPCSSLDEADLQRLGEPFWRKDASRTAEMHAGLGLALVGSICEALGWRVEYRLLGSSLVARLLVRADEAGALRGESREGRAG